MKVLTVIGARPQFVKAAVVSHALAECGDVEEILVHTGQHYDANMSDVFFEELGIPSPKFNLGIGGGMHGEMTGAQLAGIEKLIFSERPDCVLVYGDTNSTLAGALAAVKLHVPVAHVEAGLRSFNRRMPEEVNRVVTDHVSSLLFCPTRSSQDQLLKEGLPIESIKVVGDVMYDAALRFGSRARALSNILQKHHLNENGYILVTVHRAENTDNLSRLQSLLKALALVSKKMPVVWPIHPRTRKVITSAGFLSLLDGVHLLDPVGYLDMLMLEQGAALIATDSGGVQKEAFFYTKPCLTMRDETEWVELIELGWNTLVSPGDPDLLANALLNGVGKRGAAATPYGQGDAAVRIASELKREFGKSGS